ncbi:MAG TPA: prolyl oligopeptidase family serine peptidase [Gemmatimonadaceae bacterium]|nr:prolyl oligopeptidase family serine peptidase [Gemmatimonadaceae bacterium]
MSIAAVRVRRALAGALLCPVLALPALAQDAGNSFSLAQVLSYPFPQQLVAAPTGQKIAWVFNEQGVRNVWVAEGPKWTAQQVTHYAADDGQEITSLTFSPDGNTLIYVRGGDHDSNWEASGNLPPDPDASPVEPKIAIWAVSASGGTPKMLSEGDAPVISPKGDKVAFIKGQQIWTVPLDGGAKAKRLLFDRGHDGSLEWSPDGSKIAFVTNRGDHSFIAVFTSDSAPVRYLAPSTAHDRSPLWSPDGSQIAFIRTAGSGGVPQTILQQHPRPWAIWVANAATGAAHRVWQSPTTLLGSYPSTNGGANLHWGAGNRLVFVTEMDGWPHLYSIAASGGTPLLLTPGHFMDEYITESPDRSFLVYAANGGKNADDIDRRHIFKVPVDRAAPVELTPGTGVEWTPVVTGDNKSVAFLGGTAQRPPVPMVVAAGGGQSQMIGADQIPSDFPTTQLVTPKMVTFHASDGLLVHGQLFERPGAGKKPGIIFVHGGPPRQMLLGWHYMDYYSNSYAVNQYLANHGYVVLSVNYRLGIGHGHNFHHPDHAGARGASEYLDVVAGNRYLRTLPGVDTSRIGIWGGSYGGFLTAMALARNSNLFAAGVDMHGVHSWMGHYNSSDIASEFAPDHAPDVKQAIQVAWKSSPIAWIADWRSPVLLIQGDDDRNVQFHQTVDLVQRLRAQGVNFEQMVIPDEIHGFLRHASWLRADSATVAYFGKKLKGRAAEVGARR